MPITESVKKAMRRSERKYLFNLRRKRDMNEAVKKLRKLAEAKKRKDAETLMPTVYKAIDKAMKRGVIKKNTASRKKSRLSSLVNKI